MAHKNLQSALESFDQSIRLPRLDSDDDGQVRLREKRDDVLARLRSGLKKLFEDRETSPPTFDWKNQGSYAIGTGVKPLPGREYDIDLGLMFNVSHQDEEWKDPTSLKRLVVEALELEGDTTSEPGFMRPCVRVNYPSENLHVDLAVYATKDGTHLARGFVGSKEENKSWEEADPKGLIDHLSRNELQGADRQQYLRVVRLLKRWKHRRFKETGQNAPPGVGLTLLAAAHFAVSEDFDGYDDLSALLKVVEKSLATFQRLYDEDNSEYIYRLILNLPVVPETDVFERMSGKQSQRFYDEMNAFKEALLDARASRDPSDAADLLRNRVYDEFPEVESNANQHVPPVITSSESG